MKKIVFYTALAFAQTGLSQNFPDVDLNAPFRPSMGQPSFGLPTIGLPQPISTTYRESFPGANRTVLNFGPDELQQLQYSYDRHINPFGASTRPNPYTVQLESQASGSNRRLVARVSPSATDEYFQLPVFELQPGQKISANIEVKAIVTGNSPISAYFEFEEISSLTHRAESIQPLGCTIEMRTNSGNFIRRLGCNNENQNNTSDFSGSGPTFGPARVHSGNISLEYTNPSSDPAKPIRLRAFIGQGLTLEFFGAEVELSIPNPNSLSLASNADQPKPEPMIESRLPDEAFRLSFHYDLADEQASKEQVCRKLLNNVAQPGIGIDKLLRSDCYVYERELLPNPPVYQLKPNVAQPRVDRFVADYDVYYNFPCFGEDLAIGVSAGLAQDSVRLFQQRLQSRGEYHSFYQGNRAQQVLTARGDERLRLRNLDPKNQLANVTFCGLRIHRVEMYPSIQTLVQWINLGEIGVERIYDAIDTYRLVKGLERLEERPAVLLSQDLLTLNRLLEQAQDTGNRILEIRLSGVIRSIEQVLADTSGVLPTIADAEGLRELVDLFRSRLVDRTLEARAMVERFDYFRDATNTDKRKAALASMSMAGIQNAIANTGFNTRQNPTEILEAQELEIRQVKASINRAVASVGQELGTNMGDIDLGDMGDSAGDFDDGMGDSAGDFDDGMGDSSNDFDDSMGFGVLQSFGFLSDLGNLASNQGYDMNEELERKIKDKALAVTMVCPFAARPYVYQLRDAVLFVDANRSRVNVFDYARVSDQGCQLRDLDDRQDLIQYRNRFATLAVIAPDINLAARNAPTDDEFWTLISDHARRIVQNCGFAQRPYVYQFKDVVIYVTQNRQSYSVYRNAEIPADCELPGF